MAFRSVKVGCCSLQVVLEQLPHVDAALSGAATLWAVVQVNHPSSSSLALHVVTAIRWTETHVAVHTGSSFSEHVHCR